MATELAKTAFCELNPMQAGVKCWKTRCDCWQSSSLTDSEKPWKSVPLIGVMGRNPLFDGLPSRARAFCQLPTGELSADHWSQNHLMIPMSFDFLISISCGAGGGVVARTIPCFVSWTEMKLAAVVSWLVRPQFEGVSIFGHTQHPQCEEVSALWVKNAQ